MVYYRQLRKANKKKGERKMNKAERLAQIMFEEDEYRKENGMELMYYTEEDFKIEEEERKKGKNHKKNIHNI